MKIVDVKASTHVVPVKVPFLDEPVRGGGVVLARVETDEGITGVGITSGFFYRQTVRDFVNRDLKALVQDQNPLDTEKIWHLVWRGSNRWGGTGVVSTGLSALDIALWDIKGKAYRQPVYRLLGGANATVPAYITFGLMQYNREQLVAAAQHWVSQGHDKLKMVVAIDQGQNVTEDAARVKAVRDAVGDGVQLMFDANLLFDFNAAKALAKACEPYNITWFEEPVIGNDVRLLRALRAATTIPIAAGQYEGSVARQRELIAEGGVDIAQANVLHIGGYTQALKVAHLAQIYNLPFANGGGWPHHNMHLIAGVSNGWRVEFHLTMWLTGEAIFKSPPKPEKGWVTIPETPGLGLEPNEEALQEYLEP